MRSKAFTSHWSTKSRNALRTVDASGTGLKCGKLSVLPLARPYSPHNLQGNG